MKLTDWFRKPKTAYAQPIQGRALTEQQALRNYAANYYPGVAAKRQNYDKKRANPFVVITAGGTQKSLIPSNKIPTLEPTVREQSASSPTPPPVTAPPLATPAVPIETPPVVPIENIPYQYTPQDVAARISYLENVFNQPPTTVRVIPTLPDIPTETKKKKDDDNKKNNQNSITNSLLAIANNVATANNNNKKNDNKKGKKK